MRHRVFLAANAEGAELFRWTDGRLAAAWRENAATASLAGAVYLGRVLAIDSALGAAFVDLGHERAGLLPLKKSGVGPNEGEAIVVQVRRDSWGEKGPRLSRAIKTETDYAEKAAKVEAPSLLVAPPPLWVRVLGELDPAELDEITCDRRVDAGAIAQWSERHAPELTSRIRALPSRDWAPGREEALDEIAAALEETVALTGGGSLLVEPMRTLTAIDVNSAGAGHASEARGSALEVNLEAAAEIPRQLSLRNPGGVIVVDFIDIEHKEKRAQVVETLRQSAGIDPSIEWIGNMSRLGLVEIQRRRRGPNLSAMWADLPRGESVHGRA